MLSFANPLFLGLLPLPALLVWWWVRRRSTALRYSAIALVAGLPGNRARWATWGKAALRGFALLMLILSLAGPRTPDLQTRLPADGIAILLVLDISGSMGTADFSPSSTEPPMTRLDAAKAAFKLFVIGGDLPDGTHFDGRSRDQIGLVTFAAVPRTLCPLTLNHTVTLKLLDEQKPKIGPDAGTNIGDAIAEGLNRLEGVPQKRKVMILLSDGEHNISVDRADPPLKPRQAARLAKGIGVPIYAIDCGGEPGPNTPPEVAQQRADGRRALEAIAEMTDGKAFQANSAKDLQTIYRDIDALERQPTDTFRYRRYHEFYPWCALIGIVALATVTILERTWWQIGP